MSEQSHDPSREVRVPDEEKVPSAPSLRVRAVDQIKRLPQIIIGFSAVFCANKFYEAFIVAQTAKDTMLIVIPISAITIFITLVIPFYLSIERHFDEVFLDHERQNSGRLLIFYNVFAMTVTSLLFAVLAISLDVNHHQAKTPDITTIDAFTRFIDVLFVLYIYDLLSVSFSLSVGNYSKSDISTKRMMYYWIVMDAAILAMIAIYNKNAITAADAGRHILWAEIFGAAHLVRLFFEFFMGSEFYLPSWGKDRKPRSRQPTDHAASPISPKV